MFFPPREIVEQIKKQYHPGDRVELISMDDPYRKIEPGTKGTVIGVDDTGTIHVSWDNNVRLGVVYGEDACRKLDAVKVTCYGKEETWDSRKEAADFYLRAIAGSEGSECERYTKIYTELLMGKSICTDEE